MATGGVVGNRRLTAPLRIVTGTLTIGRDDGTSQALRVAQAWFSAAIVSVWRTGNEMLGLYGSCIG